MRRRAFIALMGGAAAWSVVARAQTPQMPVIGYLHSASPGPNVHLLAAFRQSLAESGYVEGENIAIEYRWAEDRDDRLPALAADLVDRQVSVIVAESGTATALAAKAATTTIPVVFRVGADPVRVGLVASFSRPGGNLTGLTMMTELVIVKRFEIVNDLMPTAKLLSILLNSTNPNLAVRSHDLRTAAASLGRQIDVLTANDESGIDAAFADLARHRPDALLVQADPFFFSQRHQIIALAARHAVPAVYEQREYAVAGGLLSYGANLADLTRRAAIYVARILNGENPADLPVEQPTRFNLVINLKTASALGLNIPPSLLARVDEVIE